MCQQYLVLQLLQQPLKGALKSPSKLKHRSTVPTHPLQKFQHVGILRPHPYQPNIHQRKQLGTPSQTILDNKPTSFAIIRFGTGGCWAWKTRPDAQGWLKSGGLSVFRPIGKHPIRSVALPNDLHGQIVIFPGNPVSKKLVTVVESKLRMPKSQLNGCFKGFAPKVSYRYKSICFTLVGMIACVRLF